ncbi:ATP-dependent RNA helicase HrpA [Brachybacterium saurashtrense]|uniref:ATP-dependent RNA helicase HrpA n=1 Tax=Brachybacterium saurashtrense TaxID=556288 RepID=A0A345YNH8_9MICO|nr:ATP-dependent RNA helicase HrpA [Brachybacterium saurashtrense]AXK45480.1 ATP-dependent RNA helicase HrpA [Brachybacterium saurashtrense]RRR21148.1 ATP-dependent RNA helicase HrpA [Brachybacterium saurashtrense]
MTTPSASPDPSAPHSPEKASAPGPRISYPGDLPVSQRREDIQRAIAEHQVVVIAGATGSGKTTQIPKMLLEMGYGERGKLIGHTQPRRIAARSVAQRIASELGEKLGEGTVGYQVRFTRETSRGTRLKLMTDGILLAEIGRDRLLTRYDAIIIDEAHERSLTIDVILGYLRQILPQRPDLKVIITSATIDPERFAEHFAAPLPSGEKKPAPIIEVSGRTYPVEIRYRPLVLEPEVDEDDELEDVHSIERDLTQAITDAVDELAAEGPGDMLVFLPGEREIREISDALTDHLSRGTRGRSALPVEVLPLFGRLSAQDQQKIFSPPKAGTYRRIILSTNVAETSLTVPGITYVIDSGLARISRYSQRTKVQRLPIEPISQASANQRSGRSGRTAPGIAIRLFSEEDFESRPEFTEPEILRTSLASVVLLMTSLGLGDVESFPFVEPPASRAIADGVRLLDELGAIESDARAPGGRRLTAVGRTLARFPLDPRMARMLIEADRLGALREVLVIVAALSIQDPRERPLGQEQQAREKHRRFDDETSDFLAFLNLWNHLQQRRTDLSSSAFRREVRAEHLHYLRIREWWDLHAQLRDMAKDAGLSRNDSDASPQAIHQSLLAGLLSHVGLLDDRTREYAGARGARFALWPGSALAKKRPDYVMVAELVETSRLWGRTAARIDPAWAEETGAHVVKRSHSAPHWSSKRASAMAHQKVTLFGVPLVADRVVGYGRIAPEEAREIFLQHALIEGDWRTRHHFFRDNRALIQQLEELEAKTRRRDLLISDEQLFRFYDERIPAHVVSGRHFDSWWKKARHETPDLLTLTEQDLLAADEDVAEAIAADFPDTWVQGDITLPLSYSFGEVGAKGADGVTATIPLAVLNRLAPRGFDWLVPGMREELVTELIRSLPKPIRRHLVPAPERAKAVAARLHDDDPEAGESFLEAAADELVALPGVPDDLPLYGPEFDLAKLPVHLRMHFRVVDEKGRQIGTGDDLEALKGRLKQRVDASVSARADSLARTDLPGFPSEGVPAVHESVVGGLTVTGYPALVARRGEDGRLRQVDLAVLATADEQELAHREGVLALLDRDLHADLGAVLNALPNPTKLAVAGSDYASTAALLADASRAATAHLAGDAAVRTRAEYDTLLEEVRRGHDALAAQAVKDAASALAVSARLHKQVGKVSSLAVLSHLTQIREHAASLLGDGFIYRTGLTRLKDLSRYLEADALRLEKLPDNPRQDEQLAWQVEDLTRYWQSQRATLSARRRADADVREIDWLLEELRVSLFAQTLGTAQTVSDKRIRKAIAELTA